MSHHLSTFDKLVDSLSTEEAQIMLLRIADSMKISADIQTDSKTEPLLVNEQFKRDFTISDEPFFIRFWLYLKSFVRSMSIEIVYKEELLQRIGRDLYHNYRQYINIKDNTFTNDFYELLCGLRKTQLFFTSLLSAYDIDKGNFYLLVSSFVTPEIYLKLMADTDPYTLADDSPATTNLRADFLKKIDDTFSLITSDCKSEMYRAANAIEWMRHFCELPIDKVILCFTVNPLVPPSCHMKLIATEIGLIASVLNTVKPIPNVVLQALFLLSKQDKLDDKFLDINKESVEFISQASHALEAIKRFSVRIPILNLARYVLRSVYWEPQRLESGEDWFLLFKNAWKKRFNERWRLWSIEQKRSKLKQEMLTVLNTDRLKVLPCRPWEDAWLILRFKREFSLSFLSSFFSSLYPVVLQPVLKTLLMEGNFYRRENLAEYTNAFTVLEKQSSCIATFEFHLSAEGEIGAAFLRLKEKMIASLKSKATLESLMKNIESEAKQIIASSQGAFNTLLALLNGFIEGNKNNVYAPLLNWLIIQGNNNADFRKQVEKVRNLLQRVTLILLDAETIETDI